MEIRQEKPLLLPMPDTQIAKLIEKNLVNLTLENIDSYDDSSEEFKIIKEILSRFNILTKENKLLNYRTILKEHPLNNIDESGVKVTTNLIFNENKYIFVTNLDNHFYLKIKKNNDLFDDLVKLKSAQIYALFSKQPRLSPDF